MMFHVYFETLIFCFNTFLYSCKYLSLFPAGYLCPLKIPFSKKEKMQNNYSIYNYLFKYKIWQLTKDLSQRCRELCFCGFYCSNKLSTLRKPNSQTITHAETENWTWPHRWEVRVLSTETTGHLHVLLLFIFSKFRSNFYGVEEQCTLQT